MGKVFISYRRDDAAGYARAIYEALSERFSRDNIFMDVDAIEPGLPFDEVIRDAVGQSEVLLVLIGARWLVPDDKGRSRLDDERDFVRLEIAAALARDTRVIPVLLDGTPMPTEAALPEALRGLVWRNALEISNSRFNSDVARLADALSRVLGDGVASATMTSDPPPARSVAPESSAPAASARSQSDEPATDEAGRVSSDRVAGADGRLRYLIGAGVLVLVGFLAWFLLPPPGQDTAKSASPDGMEAMDFEARPWGVVFGSDRTLPAARDELLRAKRSGVEDTGLYLRNGFYASIALRAERAEANQVLGVVRQFRADAYIADMRTWCLRPEFRVDYVECQAGGSRN